MSEQDEDQYDIAPADFDLKAWVAGVHPNVKTVPVYARPDLEDEVAMLRDRLAKMPDEGPQAERGINDEGPGALRTRIETLTAELEASRVDFRVEGRSTTRRKAVADALKEQGVDEGSEDFTLHLLAEQIIHPPGVTFDDLKAMTEAIEPQVVKLIAAAHDVNTRTPRVDVPFSRGSSGSLSPRRT